MVAVIAIFPATRWVSSLEATAPGVLALQAGMSKVLGSQHVYCLVGHWYTSGIHPAAMSSTKRDPRMRMIHKQKILRPIGRRGFLGISY